MGLKKYCKCGRLIDAAEECCEFCRPERERVRLEQQKKYNRYKRQDAEFYKTKDWEEIRAAVLAKYNYLDLYEYFINDKVVSANVVHHIEELKNNKDLGMDMNNLIPLSHNTHKKIHKLYNNKAKREETKEELKKILSKAEQLFI